MTDYEYDQEQGFFCKDGVELTQSDVLAELSRLAATEHAAESLNAALGRANDRAEAAEAALSEARAALEHSTWMNRWQFDEHRTGGAGELKDDAFCRCDWCKTYRDTRHDDEAPLARPATETEG